MPTGLIYDERFGEHDTGPGHPECPARLPAIVEGLETSGLWDRLVRLDFDAADRRSIERVHEANYVDRCFDACRTGQPFIDTPDSAICPASARIAQLAAGGVIAAVDAVMAGTVDNAFCAVRPPGHHAEADRSMGFCLFNNVAIAAEHLIAVHGLERVAIVDWDVHHGNGTQHHFEDRRDVLFISIHEHPHHLYPGTGFDHETGRGDGEGYTANIPLDPGHGDQVYQRVVAGQVVPRLERFSPRFLLISAGFDASRGDPLAHMEVTPEGFAWMTHRLIGQARRHCGGRVVSVLEGGYNLKCLARCVRSHVAGLLSE